MGSRTIVVGDIHGCYDELEDLLREVDFGPAIVSSQSVISSPRGQRAGKCWIALWLTLNFLL